MAVCLNDRINELANEGCHIIIDVSVSPKIYNKIIQEISNYN
jgi:hypothetical protein